jgi:AcrR family transcriptional regulator
MARPPSDISSRILRAARAHFLNEGVDGAALRGIAREAGTNIGMVYYYFKTKDDLFLAVVEDVYAGLLSDMTAIMGLPQPEEERLQALYQRMSRMSDEEFDVLRLILREALISSTRLTRIGELFLRGHIPVILTFLAEGTAKQRLRSDLNPLLLMAAMIALGMMPQIVRRLLTATELPVGALLPPASELARVMSGILLSGIGPQAPPLPEPDRKP